MNSCSNKNDCNPINTTSLIEKQFSEKETTVIKDLKKNSYEVTQREAENQKLIWLENNKWSNTCQKCKIVRNYTNKWNSFQGLPQLCSKCVVKGSPFSEKTSKLIIDHKIWKNQNGNWCRLCILCKKTIQYSRGNSIRHALFNLNKLCRRCVRIGKRLSVQTKQRMSDAHKGKRVSALTKSKLSIQKLGEKNPMFGKEPSDTHRERMRNAALRRLENNNTIISFNKEACSFIDNYGKQNDYNFRHALNGGEVKLCGFVVDGYDKNKNVVFEYDEPRHEQFIQKIKDVKRTAILYKLIGCQVLRYSRKYNRLYYSTDKMSKLV